MVLDSAAVTGSCESDKARVLLGMANAGTWKSNGIGRDRAIIAVLRFYECDTCRQAYDPRTRMTQTHEGQAMAMIARGAHAMQSRAAARQPKELYNDK